MQDQLIIFAHFKKFSGHYCAAQHFKALLVSILLDNTRHIYWLKHVTKTYENLRRSFILGKKKHIWWIPYILSNVMIFLFLFAFALIDFWFGKYTFGGQGRSRVGLLGTFYTSFPGFFFGGRGLLNIFIQHQQFKFLRTHVVVNILLNFKLN